MLPPHNPDPLDPLVLDFNFLSHPDDIVSLREGLKVARECANHSALAPYRGHELTPGPEVASDADLALKKLAAGLGACADAQTELVKGGRRRTPEAPMDGDARARRELERRARGFVAARRGDVAPLWVGSPLDAHRPDRAALAAASPVELQLFARAVLLHTRFSAPPARPHLYRQKKKTS